MNTKLIDSLAQIISSLTEEEKHLLYSKLDLPTPPAETSKLDLESEPFVGMWRDRKEMTDSVEWVRQHRQQEWTYSS